jgi:hypothetical protein
VTLIKAVKKKLVEDWFQRLERRNEETESILRKHDETLKTISQ